MTDLSSQPSESEVNLVIALFSNGKFQEAIDEVESLIKSFPEVPLLHNIMGACYAGLGMLGSAIISYDKAIAIKPDYAKAYFNLGGAHHELRQYDDSVKSYEKSLEIDPNYAEAHNNLGNVLRDSGELEEAVISYEKALIINPDYLESHYSLGTSLQELGQWGQMLEHLQQAVSIQPNLAEAHNRIGTGLEELGRVTEAVESYKKAIEINPGFAEAFNNLGNAFKYLGQLDESVKSYQKALKINPDYPALHSNLGNVYKEIGQLDDALNSYLKGLTYNPDYIDLLNNLGVVFNELGQLDKAINSYKRAIVLEPDYAEAHNNLGVTYNKLGQLEQAIKSYERALAINPDFPDPYNNLTIVYRKQGLINDVIESFKKAIDSMAKVLAINPDDADTHNNMGIALYELERLDAAAESYQKAIAINPNFSDAHCNLGAVFQKLKKCEDAIKSFEKAFVIKPDIDYILGNILGAKIHCCNWDNLISLLDDTKKKIVNNEKAIDSFVLMGLVDDPALLRKVTELKISSDYPKSNVLPKIDLYPKHKKILIGYFSADFREHPVGFLTAELYEVHDRNHFEIHAFSFGPDTKDEINLRIKAGVDHYHDVDSLSHQEIVLLARSLEIDIAVDLGGFTAESRPDVFAMSAAPIQISYIGFLGTMGADYYDYLIADPIMIPKESQKYYSEKIVYLPSFQVNDSKDLPPEITLTRKDVGLPEKGFVFCCFNNTYKITPAVFDSWARILKGVKDSVLMIYTSNDSSKINLAKEMSLRGVEPSRLIFGESIPKPEYLARYRVADLFLDTHPYNAGTTASDALRMGLPMLTLKGQAYQARMGASIVNALNLPELITTNSAEYESMAIELAKNPAKLRLIKDKLESNLSTAPLFDTKLFTKSLEFAYTEMYENHHKGLEPDHIYVE